LAVCQENIIGGFCYLQVPWGEIMGTFQFCHLEVRRGEIMGALQFCCLDSCRGEMCALFNSAAGRYVEDSSSINHVRFLIMVQHLELRQGEINVAFNVAAQRCIEEKLLALFNFGT
jgi:hypothetical protein